MFKINVTGMSEIRKGFQKSKEKTHQRVKRGLIKGSLVLKRASQERTPVEYGNLVNSTYIVWEGGSNAAPSFNNETDSMKELVSFYNAQLVAAKSEVSSTKESVVEFGFACFYGIFVHEDLNATHRTGEAKFLEKAAREEAKAIIAAIRSEASKQ